MKTEVSELNRRNFIRYVSTALALPMVGFGVLDLTGCAKADISFAHSVAENNNSPGSWKTVIVSDNEPGEPLIVSGTIYAPDRRTPMDGITLSVYQTDATGRYSTQSGTGGDNRNTRLHGSMRTNAEGRYEFRTIKPAPYPGGNNPAHIHAFVSGPGYPEYWIDEYLFEGDPFITEGAHKKFTGVGTFSSILKLTRGGDGVLRGVRDIKVERCSNNCTGR
jgi:protocatechuate 3,4-dioxygenase beta subunit